MGPRGSSRAPSSAIASPSLLSAGQKSKVKIAPADAKPHPRTISIKRRGESPWHQTHAALYLSAEAHAVQKRKTCHGGTKQNGAFNGIKQPSESTPNATQFHFKRKIQKGNKKATKTLKKFVRLRPRQNVIFEKAHSPANRIKVIRNSDVFSFLHEARATVT